MGYYNNKWRKILTILMIINLCFILFAKVTKVFGVTTYSETLSSDIEIPDWLYDYNFRVDLFNNSGGYFFLGVTYLDKQYKLYYQQTGAPNEFWRTLDSVTYYNFSIVANKNTILSTLQNLSSSQFNTNTGYQIFTDFKGTEKPKREYFYNFDVYSYQNQNEIVKEPNISNPFYPPYFQNSSEIEAGYPDGVYISIEDYDKNENLYFHLLQVDSESIPTPGNSVFYYSDNMFQLNKNSSYYKTFPEDIEEKFSYYYIPRYELSFNMNTSYVYVLTSSPDPINNSYNHIEKDIDNGIFDVIESDTTGVMTATDLESDRLNRIEQETVNQANNTNSINNSLTNTNTDSSSEQEISNNLNFNNSSGLDNLNQGFFSRLTTLLNTIVDYDLEEVDSVNFPIPFTNKNVTLYSNMVSAHIPESLKTIFQVFWLFLFNFYLFKFINKLYIAFSTGKILSGFSSSDEVITNSML